MSILFEALNRASQEKMAQGSSQDEPPTLLFSAARARRVSLALISVCVLVAVVLGGGLFWGAFVPSSSEQAQQQTQEAQKTIARPADEKAKDAVLDRQAAALVPAQTEPSSLSQGILLIDTATKHSKKGNPKKEEIEALLPKEVVDHPLPQAKNTGKASDSVNQEDETDLAKAKAFISVEEDHFQKPMHEAYKALGHEDYDKALLFYNQILKEDPSYEEALVGKAYVLACTGALDEALRMGRKLVEAYPANLIARANYAQALAEKGGAMAQEKLQLLREAYPTFPPLYVALARLAADRAQYDVALRYQSRALELDPERPTYVLGVAILYDRLGQKERALQAYQTVMRWTGEASPALPLTRAAIAKRIAALTES